MTNIAEMLKSIQEIKSSLPEGVTLVAATKTVPADIINLAIDAGLTDIGENRPEELCEKYPFLKKEGVRFHIIGGLQTRKVKSIIDKVDMIQSLDRPSLAKEIDKRSKEIGKITDCLIEINLGKEEGKSGVYPEDALEFYLSLCEYSNIRIRGVMAVPPVGKLEEYYNILYKIYADILKKSKNSDKIDIISVGMSSDYKQAVSLGSNMVRVGSKIFGKRNYLV